VYIADAGSGDRTREVALSFSPWLNIAIIPGGSPAVGRNNGARQGSSRYLLFLDANVEIYDPTLVQRTVVLAREQQMHCVTTAIACPEGNLREHLLYLGSNCVQRLSRFFHPLSTGMYMLFDRAQFEKLGGFPEHAVYAESYLLSRKVDRSRFAVVPGRVLTSKRRAGNNKPFPLMRLLLSSSGGKNANVFAGD